MLDDRGGTRGFESARRSMFRSRPAESVLPARGCERCEKTIGERSLITVMPVEQGVALENSTSTSQQDLQSYSQQPPMAQPPTATTHSPAGHHYIYPHSPVPPQSPVSCVIHFF